MVVGESDFRHQVEDDIRPFRDVFMGVFFVTIGMQVDPAVVAVAPGMTLAWIAAFIPGKALAMLAVARIMRWPAPTAVRLSIALAHGGEFGLLLLTQSLATGIVPPTIGQPALMALVLSMWLAPVLIQRIEAFGRLSAGASRRSVLEAAGLSRACLLVVTFDRRAAVERLLHLARTRTPPLPAFVSTSDDREVATFATAGAVVMVPENLAAGLALAAEALRFRGLSQEEAAKVVTSVRATLNPELQVLVGS
jgi:Kef-type K+ transport system membrane component KefB